MKLNIQDVKDFISSCSDETKVYIGCDSERFKRKGKWFAEYTIAIVVHLDGSKGCRIFGEVRTLEDFDSRKEKPFNRMMQEVYFTAETFLALQDVLWAREFELHIDINPKENFGSNCAYQAAVGYIKGTCNVIPMAKPNAFCASFAADRLGKVKDALYSAA